jgi:hypothetical protein
MSEHADIVIFTPSSGATALCRCGPSLFVPRSFAAGHDYARHEIEKRGAYSLPLARAASS